MAVEKSDDPIEAMLSAQTPDPQDPANPGEPPAEQAPSEEKPPSENPKRAAREPRSPPLRPPTHSALEARLEVRPIGTPLGLRELAALHKPQRKLQNMQETRTHE